MPQSQIGLSKFLTRQLLAACMVFGGGSTALAMPVVDTSLPVLQQFAPLSRLAGQGQMRFLGLRIYDARLWVGAEFDAQEFWRYPLALELTYHRAFTAKAIAERSVQEMERQRTLPDALAQQWTVQLAQWLPDVKAGDKLTGLYLPGQGMRLWLGEQALGVIHVPDLAKYFFGIWLSPQTSEPALRSALLAGLYKSVP